MNTVSAVRVGYVPKELISQFASSPAPGDNAKVTAFLLAPALGTYDFIPEGGDMPTDGPLFNRKQLIDFKGLTLVLGPNDKDQALSKYILDSGFHGSTLVGSNPLVSYSLAAALTELGTAKARVVDFSSRASDPKKHDFMLYLFSDEFSEMLTGYFK